MILKTICEKMQQQKQELWFAFIDLAKAYDSIDRGRLW